jgi:thymidylate kinase
MVKQVYAIEGLDRLGKSTLINNIKQQLGFYQVIHFSKPEKLEAYRDSAPTGISRAQEFEYQKASFINSMLLAKSAARLIFDRWHLGEAVYAPMYRAYAGDYVFDIEKNADMQAARQVQLILLTEDFSNSKHFESDGGSFNDRNREEEQKLFLEAFHRSILPNKKIVCVTEFDGKFKTPAKILHEVLN